jgi:drug/metabolite transporter (DMT)-like permease
VLLAAVLWGFLGLFSAALLDRGLHSTEIAFWRATLGGGAFAAHAFLVRAWVRVPRRAWGGMIAFAWLGVTLFYLALVNAIDAGGISLAFILLYTAPAWVIVLAGPVLNEPVRRAQWGLVGAAMAGTFLVSLSQGSGINPSVTAISWGLLAGAGYASYYLLGRRLMEQQPATQVYAVVMLLGAASLAPFVTWSSKDPVAWALLAGAALVCTYAAYSAYAYGLTRSASSSAVVVATIEPVVAGALAWWVYGEFFGGLGMAGAAIVLASAIGAGLLANRTQANSA